MKTKRRHCWAQLFFFTTSRDSWCWFWVSSKQSDFKTWVKQLAWILHFYSEQAEAKRQMSPSLIWVQQSWSLFLPLNFGMFFFPLKKVTKKAAAAQDRKICRPPAGRSHLAPRGGVCPRAGSDGSGTGAGQRPEHEQHEQHERPIELATQRLARRLATPTLPGTEGTHAGESDAVEYAGSNTHPSGPLELSWWPQWLSGAAGAAGAPGAHAAHAGHAGSLSQHFQCAQERLKVLTWRFLGDFRSNFFWNQSLLGFKNQRMESEFIFWEKTGGFQTLDRSVHSCLCWSFRSEDLGFIHKKTTKLGSHPFSQIPNHVFL